MEVLAAWLWNERFWLPVNVTWADLERENPDGYRAVHLLAALPLAAGLLVLRHFFERFIAKPCAVHINIEDSGPHRVQPNAILEKVFTSITKCPDARRLEGLSKQLDWDVRKIQRWFRHRRNQDKPSTLTKFCESMWRFTFYLSIFTYGFSFLWLKPPFRHLNPADKSALYYSIFLFIVVTLVLGYTTMLHNYPYQPITSDIYYYYITELAYYSSLLYSQFTDIKRKDFTMMFVHHVAAVGLFVFSYINHMVRVGTLVICLHDSGDILLELAKLFNYAKYQRLCDATFIIFSVVFLITRLGIFPIWILSTTMFESWKLIGPYPSWWLFNSLLLIIQVLHIIWSYYIIRIAYKAVARGKVSKDERSDVESSSDDDDVTSNNRKGILNTASNDRNRINGHVISDQWAEE